MVGELNLFAQICNKPNKTVIPYKRIYIRNNGCNLFCDLTKAYIIYLIYTV